jgi:hypothetical protein
VSIERLGQDAALLEAALRERLRPDDPSLRDLLARRPEWGEILVQASAGEFAPKVLSELQAAERPEDRRWIDELSAEARARTPAAARPRASRPTWVLAAAALLCVAGGIALWNARTDALRDDRQSLGPNDGRGSNGRAEVTCRAPAPEAPAYETFDWDANEELGEGEAYEVVVRTCPGAGPTSELARVTIQPSALLAPEELTRWSPAEAERALWPDCVEWTVTLLDANRIRRASDSARVERSAR